MRQTDDETQKDLTSCGFSIPTMITFFLAVGVIKAAMFVEASNRSQWRLDKPGLEKRAEIIPGEFSAIEIATARAGFFNASTCTTLGDGNFLLL